MNCRFRIFLTRLGLAAWLATVPAVLAQSQDIPSLKNPNVQKLSARVYALVGDMDVPNPRNQGFICNSAFVITQQGVVVIDPGGSLQIGNMVLREIRRVTDKPITHVINTHHHADHWMGNQAFAALKPRPQILGHPTMRNSAQEIGTQWVGIIAEMTQGANRGTTVVLPDKTLNGGEVLKFGDVSLEIYHPAHAHTQGDLVVYIPEERTLIAGDVLFYLRTPGFQDASPLGNAKALQEIKALKIDRVIPGHGPVTDASGIDYMLDYITLLHHEVEKYFKQGLSDFEMKDKIDVGKYRAMSGFDERFGINVNRMYLEVEANSF